MNIIEAKKLLQTKGYCNFDLKEFNEELLTHLEKFKCNSHKNIKKWMNHLRLDYCSIEHDEYKEVLNETFDTFDSAKEKANKIFDLKDSINVHQVWYYKPLHEIDKSHLDSAIDVNIIKDFLKKMIQNLYDFENIDKINISIDFTYYDIGGGIESHEDSPRQSKANKRLCNVLIYLNESYDYIDGGILKLENEHSILPVFGNVAIIDLNKFNPTHEVTIVTNGIGRYALLAYVSKDDL